MSLPGVAEEETVAKRMTEPREATFCDVCGRENNYLQTCIACGREFCITCDAVMAGCMVRPSVCRRCPNGEAAKQICDKYAPRIVKIVKKRDAEIAALLSERIGGES